MKNSIFWRLLTGYEKSEADFDKSRVKRMLDKTFTGIGISGVTSSYARFSAKSRISNFLKRITAAFCYSSSRAFGALLLAFGLVTLLINFSASYFLADSAAERSVFPLVVGALIAIIGVFFSFSGKPLCQALGDFAITDFILFEFLRIKRGGRAPSDIRTLPSIALAILGILLAILGYFVSVEAVISAAFAIAFIALSFPSPEFTFLSTLIAVPYLHLFAHPTLILCIMVGICALSFARKVALGKRIFTIEQYDVIILLFIAFVLVSGIFNGGANSFQSSLILAALMLGYLPASNLISNRRLADCAFNAVIAASVPVALLAVVEYALGLARFDYMDQSFIGVISGRATSTFDNPNVLAVYLIITTVFALGYTFESLSSKRALIYLGVFALNFAALVFTWSRGAWIAISISLMLFIGFKLRRHAGIMMIILAALPYALFFLPEPIMLRILSIFNTHDTSASYRLSIYRSSLDMFRENPLTGVGVGSESFSNAFLSYAENGVTAPHSHNIFLEIACEAGAFALILFLCLLLSRIRHHASYAPYIKSSSVGSLSYVCAAALFALVLFGMTDYIFYDAGMYFMFFTVFGLGSALLRIAKREHHDRVSYYSEMDKNASAIDIGINSNL